MAEPEIGKEEKAIDHRVLTKSSHNTLDPLQAPWPWSSNETAPNVRTAEDSEVYAMKHLSRHKYKGSNASEIVHYEMNETKKHHDPVR